MFNFNFNFLNTLSAGVLSIAAVLSTSYGADEAVQLDASMLTAGHRSVLRSGSADGGDDDTRSVMSAGSSATISAVIGFEPREITGETSFDDLLEYVTYLLGKIGEYSRASRQTQTEIKGYLVSHIRDLSPVTGVEYRRGTARRVTLDRSISRLLDLHRQEKALKEAAEATAAAAEKARTDAEAALAIAKTEKGEAEKSATKWKTVAGVAVGAGVVVVAVILGNLDRVSALLARFS